MCFCSEAALPVLLYSGLCGPIDIEKTATCAGSSNSDCNRCSDRHSLRQARKFSQCTVAASGLNQHSTATRQQQQQQQQQEQQVISRCSGADQPHSLPAVMQ